MKISRSTGYGLLASGYIAKNEKDGIVLSQTISKEYNIPLEYLLKILQQLVRANLLRSKRGPRGGHLGARRGPDFGADRGTHRRCHSSCNGCCCGRADRDFGSCGNCIPIWPDVHHRYDSGWSLQ